MIANTRQVVESTFIVHTRHTQLLQPQHGVQASIDAEHVVAKLRRRAKENAVAASDIYTML